MTDNGLRSFITSHHASNAERMFQRAKQGVACTSFKPVDYDQIKSLIAEKKCSAQQSLLKLKKIEATARHRKDENLLKQHVNIWNHELARLSGVRKQLETDMKSFEKDAAFDDAAGLQQFHQEIKLYRESLDEDFEQFKTSTNDPVWQLRDDLNIWIRTHSNKNADGAIELEEPEQVLATVCSVSKQQDHILGMLLAEQACLETELHIDGLIDPVVHTDVKPIQTGIPEEAFNLECPDLQFKVTLLEQFIILDGKYVEKLNEFERQNSDILSEPSGGWTSQDHDLFVYVFDEYNREVAHDRRQLFIDCLLRCLTHKTRKEIVKHEDWWLRIKFFHQRRRDLMTGWRRDRSELLSRVTNVFNEVCVSKQLEDMKLENKQKHQEVCDHLWARVNEWHQRKMEAFKLEQALAEASRAESERVRAEEEEREQRKRQQNKEKIQKFRNDLGEKRKRKEEEDRQRLNELQSYFEEQAARDKERVKFREVEFLKKQEDVQKKRLEQQAAIEERERILEALRAQVRPEVESDLLRLWSDTQAWQARHQPEEHINIQKPLFDINSYTSERIMADPRVRVEQRIREAGLQNSEYARQVLQQLQPARAPRRDMESTLFK